MNKKQYMLSLIVILFITMVIVSNSTFAYLYWMTGSDQKTALNINVSDQINMRIENPSITSMNALYPVSSCTKENGVVSGVSTIIIDNQTGVLAAPNFKLKIKITDVNGNVITNEKSTMDVQNGGNNPFRYYINYAIAEEDGSCTEPLYTGRFDVNQQTVSGSTEWYDSEWITLSDETTGFPLVDNGVNGGASFYADPYKSTIHKYKLWIWLDGAYETEIIGNNTSMDKMQKATVTVSFSENSTVEHVRNDSIGEAYAIYSADDNSLRFYRSETPIEAGSTYNGLTATAVYDVVKDVLLDVPIWVWLYSSKITKVVVEDKIYPTNTSKWFANLVNCTSIDVTKLNTSKVTDMNMMFYKAGQNATTFTIIGLEDWNTSNVTNMNAMFESAGEDATNNWSFDLSNWSVNNVIYWNNFNKNSNNIMNDKITPPNWITGDAYFVVYSADDNSLRFYKNNDTITVGNTYNDLVVTEVYKLYENQIYYDYDDAPYHNYSITNVVVEDVISPKSTSNWFYNLTNCTNIDVTMLDTSKVTDMSNMFASAGKSVTTTFTITGLENWDTSKVTDMSDMFSNAGKSATTWNIGDLSDWDTSKVTDMIGMFSSAGRSATSWSIGNLSSWDTSNVTEMGGMFYDTGYSATSWSIGNLSDWDTSNVTDMNGMFRDAGNSATTWNVGDLSDWDTSNVTNMQYMFYSAGYSATSWSIGDLSGWDTSKVTDMRYMFYEAGYSATSWSIGNLSGWDVSNVTDMPYMFHDAGYSATSWSIGNLSGWNVSNVTDMWGMFGRAGFKSSTFELNLSGWDTSKVTDMGSMFNSAGYSATSWSIGDLSGWDTSNVTRMSYMFQSAGYSATSWNIGNLSGWDTSKVTDMSYMFHFAGYSATSWSIGNLSGWDTSNVTNMYAMFAFAGYSARSWSIGDLSGWDTSNVTNMEGMFDGAGTNSIGYWSLNLSNWNVCKVTKYDRFSSNNGRGTISRPNFGMACPS